MAELFGTSLRETRKRRGLSQERLAELTGLSTNYVGEMERGLKAPGLPVIVRLARALDVGINELLQGFTEANIRRLKI
ncbi:MAG TPA: helix-turn-helix transcriptional regulator [Thermoanaerobaculia bacterium]|nr:helix-turn-helix transcriptional regulator [Thermoanaerobaculia bacterium]